MKCHNSDAKIKSMEKYSCYEWASGTSIGSNMSFNVRKCPNEGQVCDINALSDQSELTKKNPKKEQGQYKENLYTGFNVKSGSISLRGEKTQQWCTYEESLWQNLHTGTACLFSWQCLSGSCVAKQCNGKAINDYCYLG